MEADTRKLNRQLGGRLHTLSPKQSGVAPNSFAIAVAAAKFKKNTSNCPHQISREKRELLKKVGNDRKYQSCRLNIYSQLEELMSPLVDAFNHQQECGAGDEQEHADSDRSDRSEAEVEDGFKEHAEDGHELYKTTPKNVWAHLDVILNVCFEEAAQICCEKWEVDRNSVRLKAAQDHLVTAERQNREAHHNYMLELQSVRNQLLQLQNIPLRDDVKITGTEVFFYEPTEYLGEKERNLVKDIVEYKVRTELAKGTPMEDLADDNEKLRRQLQEKDVERKEIEEQLADVQSMLKGLKTEQEERIRAELERRGRRPSETGSKDGSHAVNELESINSTLQAELESARRALKIMEETGGTCPRSPISERGSLTDPVAFADDVTPSRRPRTQSESIGLQTEKEEAVAMVEQLARAAAEADKVHQEMSQSMDELQTVNSTLQAELESAQRALKIMEESGGPVKIVETERRKSTILKEVQTDPVDISSFGGPSQLEQALEITARDERIKEIQADFDNTRRENSQLRNESETMRRRLTELEDLSKNNDPSALTRGRLTVEESEKITAEAAQLRRETIRLGDENMQTKEMNTKLEIALDEMREKMKSLQDQLRAAGMGHIADRMFDMAGLKDILSNKPLNVFDRLYNDALKRTRRMAGFQKITKSTHAQALLSTVQHINRAGTPQPNMSRAGTPQQAGQSSFGVPPTYATADYSPPEASHGSFYGACCPMCGRPSTGSILPRAESAPAGGVGGYISKRQPMSQAKTTHEGPLSQPLIVTKYEDYAAGLMNMEPQVMSQQQQLGMLPESFRPVSPQYRDVFPDALRPSSSASASSTLRPISPSGGLASSRNLDPLQKSTTHLVLSGSDMPAEQMLQGRACSPLQHEAREQEHEEQEKPQIKIIIGSRVQAREKMQIKVGARNVFIKVGDPGTVVQLFPNLGVDWDHLPSIDKITVQEDMIEALPVGDGPLKPSEQVDPTPLRISTAPAPPQSSLLPQVSAALPQVSPRSGARLPQIPHTLAHTSPALPQVAASLSQMPLGPVIGHGGVNKSSSLPSLSTEHMSPTRQLPRLDSPDKAGHRRPVYTGAGHTTEPVYIGGGGAGPRPLSVPSSSLFVKNQPGIEEVTTSKSTGQLRTAPGSTKTANQLARNLSAPAPKFIVRGEAGRAPRSTLESGVETSPDFA